VRLGQGAFAGLADSRKIKEQEQDRSGIRPGGHWKQGVCPKMKGPVFFESCQVREIAK
jgi:hypothetical protein